MSIEAALTCCCGQVICCSFSTVNWSSTGATIQFSNIDPNTGQPSSTLIKSTTGAFGWPGSNLGLVASLTSPQILTRYVQQGAGGRCSFQKTGTTVTGNPFTGGSIVRIYRDFINNIDVAQTIVSYKPSWFAQWIVGSAGVWSWEAGLRLDFASSSASDLVTIPPIVFGRCAIANSNGCPSALSYRAGSTVADFPQFGTISTWRNSAGGYTPFGPASVNRAHGVQPSDLPFIQYAVVPPSAFQVSIT